MKTVNKYSGIEAMNPPGHSEDKHVIAVYTPLAPDSDVTFFALDSANPRRVWKRKRRIFAAVALLISVILAAVLVPVGLLVLKDDDDGPSTLNASASAGASATITATATSGPIVSPTANSKGHALDCDESSLEWCHTLLSVWRRRSSLHFHGQYKELGRVQGPRVKMPR